MNKDYTFSDITNKAKALESIPAERVGSKAVGGIIQNAVRTERKGFTLAEVLITLGVVGIVAVLTVPAIVRNYRTRLYVSQLQKVSAQIQDATQSVMNDEHTDKFYDTKAGTANSCSDANNGTCETGIGYLLNNYLKTIKKNCLNSTEPCAVNTTGYYKLIDGTSLPGIWYEYCVQTTNGATICGSYNQTNQCMSLLVDVNSMAEPNTVGRDVFAMDIHNDGSLSDWGSGCQDNSYGCTADKCSGGLSTGSVAQAACGCYTAVSKSNWKMDY